MKPYKTPRALIQIPTETGYDFREVPAVYLKKVNDMGYSERKATDKDYKEIDFLTKEPNQETLDAIEELKNGNLEPITDIDELMDSI